MGIGGADPQPPAHSNLYTRKSAYNFKKKIFFNFYLF